MKKTIQESITKTICDISGKELKSDYCFLELQVLAVDKEFVEDALREEQEERGRKLTKKEKQTIKDSYYELEYLILDFKPEIGYEILKFLKEKYPRQMKKLYKRVLGKNITVEPFKGH